MNVTLVGVMKLTDRLVQELAWHHDVIPSDAELIASIAMRSTRTTDSLRELLEGSTLSVTAKRMREAIEMGHYTVPGFCDFIFIIDGISRACSHQLVRHRTAWFLQQSQRAVDPTEEDDWYVTPPEMETPERIDIYKDQMKDAKNAYLRLILFEDVEEEDARFILPNATKTRIFMKIDGSNLLHFFKLRMDEHAQWEIRELAERMYDEAYTECPNIFDPELAEYWW